MADESTTPDLVERVRGLVDALDRCDVDAAVSFHAPDAVRVAAVGRFEGVAAIGGFMEDWLANYEEFAVTLEEVRDLGNGVTFSVLRHEGRVVGSSGHVQLRHAEVDVWVDGVIARAVTGPDVDEGRAAAERIAKERAHAVSRTADTIRHLTDTFNAFHRGEVSSEAIAEKYDPQIEIIWRDRQTYPDVPQQLRGIPECMTMNELYRERWIDMVQEPLEVIEAPGDRVLALIRQSGRGRLSGVPIVIHFFELCTLRDKKLSKLEFFRHRADALQAAGLEE